MRTSLLLLLCCLVLPFRLLAQNVGVGTTDPTTTLHIKSNLHNEVVFDDDFEDNAINPPYNYSSSELWFVSSAEANSGVFSLQAPGIITNKVGFDYPVDIANGRIINISGYKMHPYVDDDVFQIRLFYNNSQIASANLSTDPTSGEFEYFSSQFVVDSPVDKIRFYFSPEDSYTALEMYFDDIKIEYMDGYGLRIEDGQVAVGAMLISDSLGNASWSNDFSQFVADSSVTNELQTLQYEDGLLDITQGNTVEIDHIAKGAHKLSVTSFGGVTWGFQDSISGPGSTAWGLQTEASGIQSTAWGENTKASGGGATAWGRDTKAIDSLANAWGYDTEAANKMATSWGAGTLASGITSTAWGSYTDATGSNATTWGVQTNASGIASTAFGGFVVASGEGSTAWGDGNTASGDYSTVWGGGSTAWGDYSTAWGDGSFASGDYSTAWGDGSTASGDYSTAMGVGAEAVGDVSSSYGYQTTSFSFAEISLGHYNWSNPFSNPSTWDSGDLLFSIGNGDASSHHNAIAVVKNGKVGLNMDMPSFALDIEASGDDIIRLKSNEGSTGLRLDGIDGNNTIEWRANNVFKASLGYSIENDRIFCYQNGNVWYVDNSNFGVKRQEPSFDLHMQFNDAAKPSSSAWTVASDRRLKKDIKPFTDGLNVLMQINPVWFTYTGTADMPQETGVGTIAQELEKIAPYMVNEWEYRNEETRAVETYKAVDYGAMDFVMINAIQELKAEIDQLKADNAALRNALEAQKSE